ncbi:TldD/PmbA family protein [Oscillatoria sp. CS-180]|uniref:TldD/PmbA family protein n=1 Tax=Oscillatoria sp. CS-180 TaxID=3021720 RepID=UPI00232F2E8B|nr:TldD/PmbA family protein [Oscillatoria sp. CS-180]MDB9528556.1 TldD/PmbA family protein [Oscillatoria sp. CS-180]
MPTLQEIAGYAADSAKKQGIQKYDVYGSSVDETSVQVDRGEPKQVKASQRSSVIVRVWNEQGLVGVTTTTDVDPNGIDLALQTAADASTFGAKDHVPDFSPEATAPVAALEYEKAAPADVQKLIQTLVDAERELLEAHPAIASVPYNGIAQRDVDRFYLNSEGALRQEGRSYASVYLYSKTEQDNRKPRSAGAMQFDRGLNSLDVQACIDEASEKTISHLDYHKIDSGKYTVVFSAEAFLSLFDAFSNLFNAQSILDNRSLSTAESLGEQVAVPLLTVYDDALHAENISAETFDGEGTPTRRLPIITDGVLRNFIHSAGTAKRMGAEPTGHASIGAKVSVDANFYHIMAGQPSSETLSLDTAENVVFIDDVQALHAGVNALQGSFSLPFDGWLVNKGEKTSIESATVAGDFRDLLKSIIHVEAEAEVTPGGVCPRIWVESLSITGEG